MAQTYGFEIESFGLTEQELRTTLSGLRGYNGEETTYSGHFGYHGSGTRGHHNGRENVWASERDGSIRNTAGRGLAHEVVSPIIKGQEGLAMLKRAMKALSRAGAKVNKSCGLHITMGIRNCSARVRRMSARNLAQRVGRLVDAYDYFYGGAFCRLVSPSRRVGAPNFNGYAPRVRYSHLVPNTYGTGTKTHYTQMMQRQVGRGVVNLGKFLEDGIIEFRQHNGSLNGEKITNFALLLHKLVSWAINDEHINNGCDIRSFPPTLNGLMNMVNVGSDLRTALLARQEEVGDRGFQVNTMQEWSVHNAFMEGNLTAGMNQTVVEDCTTLGGF
tara:strand:- start:1010 stop:1999 length:990 start_codon:yes stop_codon:yes gene_type:complete